MKKYLILLPLFVITFFLILAGIIYINKQKGLKIPYQKLYDYQQKKIYTAQNIDTIFLGDSSLGNAIDAKHWQKLSGKNTINLALTASYGYEGAYSLLQQTVLHGLKPKNIILMFDLDQMRNEISYLAFLQSSGLFRNKDLPFLKLAPLYFTLLFNPQTLYYNLRYLVDNGIEISHPEVLIENDYMKQAKKKMGDNSKTYNSELIKPEKTLFLNKIMKICTEHNLNCLYAHGPINQQGCLNAIEYKKLAEKYINLTDIKIIIGTPVCASAGDIGDSYNHIAPEFKKKYTELYYQVIKSSLN